MRKLLLIPVAFFVILITLIFLFFYSEYQNKVRAREVCIPLCTPYRYEEKLSTPTGCACDTRYLIREAR